MCLCLVPGSCHARTIIDAAEKMQPFLGEISDNETSYVLTGSCCLPHAELEAYIGEVMTLYLHAHQGPIPWVKGLLLIYLRYITAIQQTVMTLLPDEVDEVLVHFPIHPQMCVLGGALVYTDCWWVGPGEIYYDPPDMIIFHGACEECIYLAPRLEWRLVKGP